MDLMQQWAMDNIAMTNYAIDIPVFEQQVTLIPANEADPDTNWSWLPSTNSDGNSKCYCQHDETFEGMCTHYNYAVCNVQEVEDAATATRLKTDLGTQYLSRVASSIFTES